jgi:putative SOS response-associated peptidase YedK
MVRCHTSGGIPYTCADLRPDAESDVIPEGFNAGAMVVNSVRAIRITRIALWFLVPSWLKKQINSQPSSIARHSQIFRNGIASIVHFSLR